MGHALTCNNLKCRAELSDRALVTTCSHIFCLECANHQSLLHFDSHNRTSCPACGTELSTSEDAVVTNLRPTEAYKTSILSGLSPNAIMECAGRALSFWAYQTSQAIIYQQHLYNTLTNKYSALTVDFDRVVNEANVEIDGLHRKLNALNIEHENHRKKSEDLAKAYKEKSRKLQQTQELCDRLKGRVEIGHIQRAASDAVDSRFNAVQPTKSHSYENLQQNGQLQHQHVALSLPVTYANVPESSRFPAYGTSSNVAVNTGAPLEHDVAMSTVSYVAPALGRGQVGRTGSHEAARAPQAVNGPGPVPNGQNVTHRIESTRFAQTRGGLSGIGLSSGIKVSQAPISSALGLATSGFRRG